MNIRELRKQKYWSQDQLAQMSGLSVRTIQRIEREAVDAVGIITAEQTDEVRKEAYAEDVKGLYKLTALAIFALGFTIVVVADETTG